MKKALILRTCNADMTSYNGFVWPTSGPVECPDWEPTEECGNGLHGVLWGEGNGALLSWKPDAVWLVAEVTEYIDLGGKVKFPRAVVVHCGDRTTATDYIIAHGARGAVIGGTATAGHRSTATAGYGGTATAGDYGTATAGHYGTATAGYSGTATAGDYGTATAGYRGRLIITHWDGSRSRVAVGYVGENGIKSNTPYKLDKNGKFVEAMK